MADRTRLTQQDEALRQVRPAIPLSIRELRTRAGLRWIASYLDGEPDTPMTGDAAKRATRLYVLAAHSDDDTATGVMWDLRRALPEVRRTDTRDTYAARLRLIVEGVAA